MQLKRIEVEHNLKEKFQFHDPSFPFGLWIDDYNIWAEHTLSCHWHDAFEIGIVLSGKVDYMIESIPVSLEKGDSIFINMNSLHMSVQHDLKEDTVVQVFVFKPEALTGDTAGTIYQKFFLPVINSGIHGFCINTDTTGGRTFVDELAELSSLDQNEPGYELKTIAPLSRVWAYIFNYISNPKNIFIKSQKHDPGKNEEIKRMLSYIHENYKKKIAVISLMRYANVSRSECFRCFKFFTGKNPIEYVNEYRLSKAACLLRETDQTVTEVCFAVGFSNSSYFGKIFKRKFGLSPLLYRHNSLKIRL